MYLMSSFNLIKSVDLHGDVHGQLILEVADLRRKDLWHEHDVKEVQVDQVIDGNRCLSTGCPVCVIVQHQGPYHCRAASSWKQ